MFRNGISAGHRQLQKSKIASITSAATPATTKTARSSTSSFLSTNSIPGRHDSCSFVCNSCKQQRRSVHHGSYKKKNRAPLKEQDISLEQIKKLEQHVQALEKTYSDQMLKRAAASRLSKIELTEDLKDKAYEALMGPSEKAATIFLPKTKQVAATRLHPQIIARLGAQRDLIVGSEANWTMALERIQMNGGFTGIETVGVNRIMLAMDTKSRAELVPKIWEMMSKAEISPDSLTYDFAMLAFADQKMPEKVKAMFGHMVEQGVKPTVYSYGHLLKAYSQEADLPSAAAAFQDMQAAGIEPNLTVYTTLIQTAVAAENHETAWQIFNLIKFKSLATAPDVDAYSLMMHACAETGDAEKALDIWNEMTIRKGIAPTQEAYGALIHACAKRKDYFSEAWKHAQNMVARGMRMNRYTLNILITACHQARELTRARLLLRHMINSGDPDLTPNIFTFQNLLRAYATYDPPNKVTSMRYLDSRTRTEIDPKDAAFVTPPTQLTPSGHDHASSTSSTSTEQEEQLGLMQMMNEIPFLPKAVLQTKREVLDEAAMVVNWLREMIPDFVDTQLLNAYLDVCKNQGSMRDLKWSYKHDLVNPEGCRVEDHEKKVEEVVMLESGEGEEVEMPAWGPREGEGEGMEEVLAEEPEEGAEMIAEEPAPAVKSVEAEKVKEAAEEAEQEKTTPAEQEATETAAEESAPAVESAEETLSEAPLDDIPAPSSSIPFTSVSNSPPTSSTSHSTAPSPSIFATLLNSSSKSSEDSSNPHPDPTPDDSLASLPPLPRNIHTFSTSLQAAVKFRDLSFARRVWRDRTLFTTHSPEYASLPTSLRSRLDLEAETLLIDALALADRLVEARERMEKLREAGVRWRWIQLRTLYVKAVQGEDSETVRLVREATAWDRVERRGGREFWTPEEGESVEEAEGIVDFRY